MPKKLLGQSPIKKFASLGQFEIAEKTVKKYWEK